MPTQEAQRLHFGSARLWGAGANGLMSYQQLQDVNIDFKTDVKEAFAEGNYAFATADGHRTIDISAKHYLVDIPTLATELGGSTPAANTVAYAIDEAGTVPTTPFKITLANSATATQPVSVVVGVVSGGVTNPVQYAIVAGGSEVAGVSCSYAAGLLTFAAADVGFGVKTTYKYTLGTAAGLFTAVTSTFQNSAATFSLTCVRRDRSRLADASTGLFIYEFNAVRSMGIKAQYQEGNYTVYERSFKAFADPMGNVLTVRGLNQ